MEKLSNLGSNVYFALDIGTRSIVGLVGEISASGVRLLAYEREEHHTRAMLDGQIHDVPEVARVLTVVKSRLEAKLGPLRKAAVAAAGRALLTNRSTAEIAVSGRGFLTREDERSLELLAIQAAQQQLAASAEANITPQGYYCVGFSVVHFHLDNIKLGSLIGQKGKSACIEIIATFLPRQVIDSLQSVLQLVGLEMSTLTLEPIAAINVLIPPTMRHLNLTLVDVGAGTSDIAITSNGSVTAYGMVPCAGDEITEAISQKYLLDFNIAEKVKRQLSGKAKKIIFTDVLGTSHKVAIADILENIKPNVAELAHTVAEQILLLNKTAPQAVLLVGGGAMTPHLSEALSQALDIPSTRVAIRCPDAVAGIDKIPAELCTPDSVTPLGILRLAGGHTLNFVNIRLNEQPVCLFNLSTLTVADALLAGGLDIKKLQGRPGLGLTISVNGETKFLPGSHGQPGRIMLNGEEVTFAAPVNEGDILDIIEGKPGTPPQPTVQELIDLPPKLTVTVNEQELTLAPLLTINDIPAKPTDSLADRDKVICRGANTLLDVIMATELPTASVEYSYFVNQTERCYTTHPHYLINGVNAKTTTKVQNGDLIRILAPEEPTIMEVLGLEYLAEETVSVSFNKHSCQVPAKRYSLTVNGNAASLSDTASNGCAS